MAIKINKKIVKYVVQKPEDLEAAKAAAEAAKVAKLTLAASTEEKALAKVIQMHERLEDMTPEHREQFLKEHPGIRHELREKMEPRQDRLEDAGDRAEDRRDHRSSGSGCPSRQAASAR